MEKSLKKINIKNILEILLMFLILIGAVKKGGFYISDMEVISFFIILISSIYIIIAMKDKKLKVNISHIFLMLLFFCYLLPVIFKKYVDKSSAIFEAIKYLDMCAIYLVVTNSENKKVYEIFLIVLGVIIGIFGIDGLANRYLIPILNIFESGYLSTYLDRLSSFIQYANTCAIILIVSFLFSIKYLFIYIDNIKKEYSISNIKRLELTYVSGSFILLCIFLTSSRLPIFLMFVSLVIICIFNKEDKLIKIITIISQIIISMIFSNIIGSLIYKDVFDIYIASTLFLILSFVIYNIILYKVMMNIKIWYMSENLKSNRKIYKVIICLVIFIGLYIIIGLNISSSLVISENYKNLEIKRNFNFDKNNNIQQLDMKIKNSDEDSDYIIEIYEQNNIGVEKLVAKFEDEGSKTGDFSIKLSKSDDIACYILKAKCNKGKISINSFKLNGKNICLDYLLLPSDLVFRFKEKIFGSVSNRVRIEYIKDGMKIFKTSPIVGRGGEAFRYLYKDFQTGNYNTTEVHSSFIQILIESGILGFLCITAWTIYIIVKSENNINKLIFVAFMLHSALDLNFSYCISAVIAALIASNVIKK